MKYNFDSNSDLAGKLIFIVITIYSAIIINLSNYNYEQIYDLLPRTNLTKKKRNINLNNIFESRQLSYVYFLY